jgi:hypothetical protein
MQDFHYNITGRITAKSNRRPLRGQSGRKSKKNENFFDFAVKKIREKNRRRRRVHAR